MHSLGFICIEEDTLKFLRVAICDLLENVC